MRHQVQRCIEPGNEWREGNWMLLRPTACLFPCGLVYARKRECNTELWQTQLRAGGGSGRGAQGEWRNLFRCPESDAGHLRGRDATACGTSHGEVEGSSDALGSREFSFTEGGLIRIVHAFLRLSAFFQSSCQPNDKCQPREYSNHDCHWNEEGVVVSFLDH